MSYLPSPYTGYYTHVSNTVVSGSQLLSYLTGADLRALEFDAVTHRSKQLVASASGPSYLSADQIVQSTINTLSVAVPSAGTGYINLGSDTTQQAQSYLSLFDINSTNDYRLLRFTKTDASTGTLFLVNGNLNFTSASSGTSVVITSQGVSSPTNTLFAPANSLPGILPNSSAPGSERLVSVHSNNLTSGSQTINFDILAWSQ